MDHRSATTEEGTGLGRFARDLAVCLAVHRDKGPAVVWPEGADAVLPRLLGVPRHRRPGVPRHGLPADPVPASRAAGTAALASRLGRLLGCRVDGSYLDLPAGARHFGDSTGGDLVYLPVRGGCRARLEPASPGPSSALLERPLELRLLAGEALYVPRGLGCVLHEVRAPSRLLVLALRPWAW
ncbi:hypothetical protein [Streptomyces sp. YIM S03343]